ncbi:MAG: 4-(cytidine 5'-diphospho)-2-C-methyl-D-erythritol kinase [Pirellulaceae bacterium]|nr:4-(cytidine 5'-diphospho)-2-C-methyl-D-erythritol kinase [Pirellulaceae bacterium]
MNQSTAVAITHPPAKVNLFLELLAKREDGFHEIDTVMVPVDLRDEMRLSRQDPQAVDLTVRWLPSAEIIARRLGIENDPKNSSQLLHVPESDANLVHRALTAFRDRFDITDGFVCQLRKRIPAGAGLGGASSDAASALLCAAELCDIPQNSDDLVRIAESIGSDVPFFLGDQDDVSAKLGGASATLSGARAEGRGEKIQGVNVGSPMFFVIVFPSASLSTAAVYSQAKIPDQSRSATGMLDALATGNIPQIQSEMMNRLSEPAKKILPRINEILESMWRSGLQACQLTGSGSACFAVTDTMMKAQQGAHQLQSMLEPGALIFTVQSTTVPSRVLIQPA